MQNKILLSVFLSLFLLLVSGCSSSANSNTETKQNNTPVGINSEEKSPQQPVILTRTITKDLNGDLPKVETSGTNLIIQGKPFYFIGANTPDLVKFNEFKEHPELRMLSKQPSIENAIRNARNLGITVLRLYIDWKWAQPEEVDYILDVARREGVYILPTFDFMDWRQNTLPYINLNQRDDIEKYKELVRKTLNRKNSVNGKLYKEDTTILGWDIANEPNLSFYTAKEVRDWLKEITDFYKNIDADHLLTIGIFPGQFKDQSLTIKDRAAVFNTENIDFFSFHVYPSNFATDCNPIEGSLEGTIANWGEVFISLDKPVVLEEYGVSSISSLDRKYRTEKTTAYIDVLRRGFNAAFANGLAGVLFWSWGEPVSLEIMEAWNASDTSINDKEICKFIQEYAP